ncbi:pyrrolidone-carboxylate peptidase [Thermococcus onnurineus NA1]|uniref:Pyrrolidone-carboxylate peptidase n=1 Tax=Thermococcus onnurineus (strain NA1) TaxID=523850 RepID=PCP_THEON|nr:MULTISPECIES: pyroglutamyl-peptidase I [Thermococcus]B6YUJ5.1 RecName: Full=Pyrrolidone-carboxylate peptidase; AltName: Full=5-oxoprolyl-peptidase; AltName: Full=Pyroglutamyl-peptidase I; Short=PGP-I; Short=Pyrase [Thermococcus onnurineus NA1]ACJ17180.1 pyrrolidone-carboxylate peptidase [Thermococcus onnurineus NA1]NJE46089.1 pyroglutamyl-peptidase I [Thermococcus sp. GR7]NJE78275.1 pyroglutamyl-peptidase I [Thermococcus sp. GR4]NJF22286.1 pyroglutamyl-peptidase I [Thermococcus sp. GR5]
MKVLITGFEPFGGEEINPSWEAVRRLPDEIAGAELIKRQLPVTFRGVRELLPRLIVETKPDLVILTGQAGGRPNITVERVAINVMDSTMPDNEGYTPEDEPIFEGAPDAYFATLPIKAIVKALREAKIPAAVSNTAGTYVCNTAMYTVLHTIAVAGMETKAGFIHVPFIHEQALDKPRPSMALETVVKAYEVIIKTSLKA